MPDAYVAFGIDTTRSGGDGRFRFDLVTFNALFERMAARILGADHTPTAPDELRALAPGYLPAQLVARSRTPEGDAIWPDPIVLTLSGEPLEGVDVHPMCDAFRLRYAGQVIGTRHGQTDAVVTDAQGRFELVGEDADAVEIRLSRRCHFQVELADAERADGIAVLDEQERALEISEFRGSSRREGPFAEPVQGRSATLAVGEEARMLVLYRDGVEVERVAIELSPDEKRTVEL